MSTPHINIERDNANSYIFQAVTGGLKGCPVRFDNWEPHNRVKYKKNPELFPLYRITVHGVGGDSGHNPGSLCFGNRRSAVSIFSKLTGVNIDKLPDVSSKYGFCKCRKPKIVTVDNSRDAHRIDKKNYTCCYRCGGYIPGKYET